jgi:hypothetical protein
VTSAQTLANYSIDNGITVLQAAVHAIVKSQVFLTVSQLSTGTYNLSVTNVADLAGNIMPNLIVMPFTASFGVNNEPAASPVRVYPNPAIDRINIEWNEYHAGSVLVSLSGLAGNKVFSEKLTINGTKSTTIDTENLGSGLYILEIKGDDMISRTKLMIR